MEGRARLRGGYKPAVADDADEATDEALMGRVAARDRAAYAVLIDRYLSPAAAFAQRMLGRLNDAEDVAQDAFLKVWAGAATWDAGRGKFRPWFYRLLYNAAIDHLRRRLPPGADGLDEVVDPADGPETTAADALRRRYVKAALEQLPERQRAAVVLCYYQGLSNREAAAILEIGVKALEALLVRARRSLAETLLPIHEQG